MANELKEIEVLSKKISNAIKITPSKCISLFEELLLGSNPNSITFDEYLKQLQKTLKVCTCQSSWNYNQITIHCLDCQKTSNSCICVNCFLKGNHQGHKIILTHSSSASCDCGDPLLWSPSGFCSDHPGPEPNPEMTQLTKETRIKLISISISAFTICINLASTGSTAFDQIIDFLSKIVSIGDATRRCVCIGFRYSIRFSDLYGRFCTLQKPVIHKLLKLFGSLTNDEIFRNYFTYSFLIDLPYFIRFNDNFAKIADQSNESQVELYNFTFHACSFPQICEMIHKNMIDWKAIFINSLNLLLYCSFSSISKIYFQKSLYNQSINRIFTIFKSAVSVLTNKNPLIIESINEISLIFIRTEFSLPITRAYGQKENDEKEIQSCQFSIYFELFRLVSKIGSNKIVTEKPLQLIEKIFENASFKSIDSSYKGDNEMYYRSILEKGVQFAQSFPTFLLSFVCLNFQRGQNFSEILKSFIKSDIEKFIKNWSIIPLRWMAASILSDFHIFERNSRDTIIALNSFKFRKNIKYQFVPTFALLQTLLKTTKDVDSFFLMIISTFGFFDCFKSGFGLDENQKQLLVLSIFHFLLCLIFDNLCVDKNLFTMRRLTVISKLMRSDLTVEEINSVWYNKVLNDDKFYNELSSFTSKVKTKIGTKFHLNENSEWHPLLPFLSISSIITLIQKFIHDNPDSLINFPELPADSVSFLFSPTLWALEYFILSQKFCKDYTIIHQLVFNALIITSQNSEQYHRNENDTNNDDDSILEVNNFNDLSMKLKKFTFNGFLKKKISLNGNKNSMVDLIKTFGNLGITVLTRLNISVINNCEENHHQKEEMIKKKRERAKQLKMQIMNNFSKKQKSFQSSTEEEKNVENSSKMECMICHLDNEQDCFVYPALIYKSPLSSYLKWRFRNAHLVNNNDKNDNSALVNDFSDVPDSFELFNFVKICMHPIHSKCIKTKLFTCPTDRCPRNSSIPIISGICDIHDKLNQTAFLQASKFLKKAYQGDLKFAVFSFASQIEIIEMRHRSNPGCLDDKILQATLRNIYLCMWHVMRNDSIRILLREEIKIRKEILLKEEETKTKIPKRVLNPTNRFSIVFKNVKVNENNENQKKKKEDESKSEDESEDEEEEEEIKDNFDINNLHLSPLMFYILFSLIDVNKKDRLSMNDFIKGNFTLFFDNCFFSFEKDLNSDYKKLQFLRSAAIFDHFARGEIITPNNEFIDWDVILSSSNLCKHFNIENVFSFDKNDTIQSTIIEQNTNNTNNNTDNNANENNNNNDSTNNNIDNDPNENNNKSTDNSNNNVSIKSENEMTLPMFSLIDLPKNFLDFIHPPYSAPILEFEECEVVICLLTGKIVMLRTRNGTSKYITVSNYLKDKFKKSFSVFLKLNGSNASEIFVSDLQFNKILSLNSFYVDKFGDKDIGMKRGSLLYLNESDKEEIIDNVFSGGWTNLIDFS